MIMKLFFICHICFCIFFCFYITFLKKFHFLSLCLGNQRCFRDGEGPFNGHVSYNIGRLMRFPIFMFLRIYLPIPVCFYHFNWLWDMYRVVLITYLFLLWKWGAHKWLSACTTPICQKRLSAWTTTICQKRWWYSVYFAPLPYYSTKSSPYGTIRTLFFPFISDIFGSFSRFCLVLWKKEKDWC